MALFLLRRSSHIPKTSQYNPFSTILRHYSSLSNSLKQSVSSNNVEVPSKSLKLSPLLADSKVTCSGECKIELVDSDTWQISTGLAEAWKGRKRDSETRNITKLVDENVGVSEDDSDFDEIDDMRVRGKLFYKIDRDSKEYEEYSYDFHRKTKSNSNSDTKEIENNKSKQKEERKEGKKKENRAGGFIPPNYEKGNFGIEKKTRAPTYNQLTAPYHEPFCLDIYVSKGSVRACIVHRATSNVVAVAHSISKDMKFDYSSKRDAITCAAVGGLLAQRALADDIHNVVFTPRKGDKIEGKLQIVLNSVIDNGVNVKVKIKQRQVKGRRLPPVWREKT